MSAVLIVESPAKAKTIKKYLGKGFEVMASYGHVRDLPAKTGAITPERDFKKNNYIPTYELIEKNAKHMDAIAKAIKKADNLYLATDPDREGEAISWHIYEYLKQKKLLKDKSVQRVVFYEITKRAVNDAVANPRDISMDLVNAQQARRALDYLFGFNLSPLLWKKVRRGLSAGRVQSPALRMIVEREEEIEKFQKQEYWTIDADNTFENHEFIAKLVEFQHEKIEQFTVTEAPRAEEVKITLEKAAKGKLIVTQVEKKQRKRNPSPPFITSTLQQEAARKLGFTAKNTMRIAQQLYEGIDLGEGHIGLITYMRTDSVNLSNDAMNEIRQVIANLYGEKNVPDKPRHFKRKVKNAQEAHEAIRPTSASILPEDIKKKLSTDQYKLYDLIWKRAVASQMQHAILDTVSVTLGCGEGNYFRANGSTIAAPGFLSVYRDDIEEGQSVANEDRILPPLKEGDKVILNQIRTEQHFTEPPPRYNEASLIKALEDYGIGRPSTYASIISTILAREYVVLDQKRFMPTDVGRIVKKFLTEYFNQYVDYNFTANLEDELDEISRGEKQWVPMMREFWQPFKNQIDVIEETVKRSDVTHEQLDEDCPKCGKKLSVRLGKRGRFIGCTGYPECDYTRNVGDTETESQAQAEVVADRKCPECNSDLQIKLGRYGKFIGCSNYPNCKHLEPLQKPTSTGVQCPECKQADLLQRKSRYGKLFYSCARYPDCKYATWNEPIVEPCPKCHWPILTLKITKRRGKEKVCPQKECGYSIQIESE